MLRHAAGVLVDSNVTSSCLKKTVFEELVAGD